MAIIILVTIREKLHFIAPPINANLKLSRGGFKIDNHIADKPRKSCTPPFMILIVAKKPIPIYGQVSHHSSIILKPRPLTRLLYLTYTYKAYVLTASTTELEFHPTITSALLLTFDGMCSCPLGLIPTIGLPNSIAISIS